VKTILIIDDSRGSQVLNKSILEKEQYKVFTASRGREGVNMARDHHPDLILMDVVMPVNDGKETAAYLQAIRKFSNIPVIFVTGAVPEDVVGKGNFIDVEGREYPVLSKPIDRLELIKRVAEALA
jgi:CheY-like chemotaxis protein